MINKNIFADSLNNEDGQSTIEFLITFVFIIGFVVMFVKTALLYTNGYLVHYATFMASRAYMVADLNARDSGTNDNAGRRTAQEVFDSYKVKDFIPGFSSTLQFNDPDDAGGDFEKNLYIGPYVQFTDNFVIPGSVGGNKTLTMRSESFLGREPTRTECLARIAKIIDSIGGSSGNISSIHITFNDNGC